MKIAILAHCAAQGGAEKISVMIANYLSNHGYSVLFLAVHYDEIEYPLDKKVEYRYIGSDNGSSIQKQMMRIISIRKNIKREQPDVVISMINYESIGLIGLRNIKKICSLRNDPARYFSKGIKRWLREKAYEDADVLVFQTKQAQMYFPDRIASKGIIIENPVQNTFPDWNPDENNPYLVTTCRLNKQKNIPMMIKAFGMICNRYPALKLKIYGEGEEKENILKIVELSGLGRKIELMGFTREPLEVVSKAKAFLLSSDYEGISNSMLEALAIGVPCVCTNCPVGGAEMFIENHKNGLLTPTGDSEAFGEAIIEAIEQFSPQKTKKHAENLRERLSEDNIMKKWIEIIERG